MRRAVAQFVAVVLICTPALAVDVVLTTDEAASCDAEGGCMVITNKGLKAMANHFHEMGYDAGYEQCKVDARGRT